MKFFVTTVSGWEPLAVISKMSILIPTGVLEPPLVEIEISKLTLSASTPQNGQTHSNCLSVFDHFVRLAFNGLNKHRISGRKI